MPDVTLRSSNTNNGTATPATPGSVTAAGNNTVLVMVAVLGTSPTVATPGGFTQVQKISGATLTVALFVAFNISGATNPSITLGGTVTGWICSIAEFTQFGAVGAVQGSNVVSGTGISISNVFSNVPSGQVSQNMFFFYVVARATATYTPNNVSLFGGLPNWFVPVSNPTYSLWSSSINAQAGVQGLSADNYWGSSLAQGPDGWPSASGSLGASVAFVAIGVWINSLATQPSSSEGCIISGNAGINNSGYQGMIGG